LKSKLKQKWGDLATLEYGKRLTGYKKGDGQFPVYGTNGLIGWHNESLCKHPGVIIGRKGVYRGVHYSDKPFFVIDTAFFLEQKIDFDFKWAYYELLTHDINTMDSGSAIPSTSREDFYQLDVSVPPLEKQIRIAQILGNLDDKITILKKNNSTLEKIIQLIFKSWFVDFDGQTEFVDSELGQIPKGWKVKKFSKIIEILSGGTPKTSIPEYWNGDVKWVSVVDTEQQPYIIETEKTISRLGESKSSAKILPSETIVITARGTVGNCSLLSEPMTINQSCYGLRGKNGIGQIFLFWLLKTNLKSFLANVHGSVFDTITRTTFEIIDTVVPTNHLIVDFEKTSRPFYNNILKNQIKINLLLKVRDTLLPKLMSGEIRV